MDKAKKSGRKARKHHTCKLVLNQREAAEHVGVSDEVMAAAMRLKQVPTLKIGERTYVPLAALERMLQGEPTAA